MAAPLRELIARVVLRMDDASLKRVDNAINATKAHLEEFQATAAQGVNVKATISAGDAERSLAAIRVSLSEMGAAANPAALAQLEAQFSTASAAADRLRLDIDQLKSADPSNPQIAELTHQLNSVESESRQTASALDKFKRSLDGANAAGNKSESMLVGLAGKLGTLAGALSVAAVGAWIDGTLQAAGAVEDLADRLGMSTDEVQVWSAFAKQAGADNEALSASLKGLANAMQGAANGGKEQRAAFEALGISTDNWKKGLPNLTETLAQVGGKLGELDNEGQRLALTQKLLSEGGLKLAPAFKGGTAAVQEQLTKLKELAVVYDEEFIKSAGAAGDELDLFYAQFRGLGSELILTFMPALRTTVQTLTPFIRGLRDAFTNSKLLGAGLVTAGAGGLASFGGISGLVARFGPALARLGALALPFLRGFLKFAAITLILDDFFVMLNGGKSVLGDLLKKFELGRTILETFQNTFKGLKGAVMVLWGALSGDQGAIDQGKALLDEYTQWIDGILGNIGFMFDDVFTRLIPEIAMNGWNSLDATTREVLGGIWEFVTGWASELGAIISGVWDAAIGGLKSLVSTAGELLGKIPGLGDAFTPEPGAEWTPIGPVAQRAKAALEAGSPGSPSLPGNTSNSNVTVTNNYTMETNIGGGAPKEVVAAVQNTEQRYTAAIRDNRKTLRHTVGATR